MADMGVEKARSEVQRMLLPFHALKSLEAVLDVASRAETEYASVVRNLESSKAVLAAVQADTKLAREQYDAQQKNINETMAALKAQLDAQEAAQREKLAALELQVKQVEEARDAARRTADSERARAKSDAERELADLASEHKVRKIKYEMEENDISARLQSAKNELAALMKRLGG